jgi:hypothetical protein
VSFALVDGRLHERDPVVRAIFRLGLLAALVCLVIGGMSAYRAYVQVYSLTLVTTSDTLRAGTTIRVSAVTSGRTPVDILLELRHGSRMDTLGRWRLPNNGDPATDPRPQRATFTRGLAEATTMPWTAGPATLRATAVGRPQWLRLPSPTLVEQAVVVDPQPEEQRQRAPQAVER